MFLSVDATVFMISFIVCQQLKVAAPQIEGNEIRDTREATGQLRQVHTVSLIPLQNLLC